ncbi:hypothetical protein KIN20_011309 [Parelaphostrongylus tenuis]|uniref:Uncharacterized protein n=1 Tax=Parelaphostrongylus tenuis TaxID=148309 RepID=A0AAD5QMD5_PARTN|nr:hypothetical protein KIN20_011309 [Parelaphostrongylus tenuis]
MSLFSSQNTYGCPVVPTNYLDALLLIAISTALKEKHADSPHKPKLIKESIGNNLQTATAKIHHENERLWKIFRISGREENKGIATLAGKHQFSSLY